MDDFTKKFPLVFEYNSDDPIWGSGDVSDYLYRYLRDIKAKTCIFEEKYIDRDYLIDYSKFYARSFKPINKYTQRFHFFKTAITEEEFKEGLNITNQKKEHEKFLEKLSGSYLGYVVLKPIKDERFQHLIGRTVLSTYPPTKRMDKREYLTNSYDVSLFGIDLKVNSLPFQVKDPGVGLCATTACWVSLFPLAKHFTLPILSPYEITEKCVGFPTDTRNFPSEGLTFQQMKNYFNSLGLDTEFIDPQKFQSEEKYNSKRDDAVADTVKAFGYLGLPVIAGLKFSDKQGYEEYHAVVISGYRHQHGRIKEIYIHDDTIGPYARVKPISKKGFSEWNIEDLKDDESNITIHKLLVPIYPKIRLSFFKIYRTYLEYKRKMEIQINSQNLRKGSKCELLLSDVKRYKKYLLEHKIENKNEKLLTSYPRFLWIIRIQCDSTPHYDYLFDGTSLYAKEVFQDIIYRYD